MFYIACVVYNKKISDIRSLDKYEKISYAHNDIKIIIVDNTSNEVIIQENKSYKKSNTIQYICNEENLGLSKAYNIVLGNTNSEDWILWTDDDTLFSEEYLNNVYSATFIDNVRVIAGFVRTNKGSLLSPISCSHDNNTVYHEHTIYNNLYCINSGLCVKRSIYDSIGYYDERMFVDMIDYWFFDELRKVDFDNVLIVPGFILQNFSGTSRGPILSKIKRFKVYSKDFNIYCSLERRPLAYRISVLVRHLGKIILGQFLKD